MNSDAVNSELAEAYPAERPHARSTIQQTVLTATECLDTLGFMDDSLEPQSGTNRRKRVVERAEQMVKSGRLTDEEAERLRSAGEPEEFDDAIRSIRVRHAGARLAPAVNDGRVTPAEADSFLDRLRNGEHSSALRAQLRKLRPGGRADTVAGRQEDEEDTSA